ncbi:MAG: DHA2 family efflux MFS transporter permease subunit [Thermoleophilaceae bacterium]|nr:DHA2 family efflux MFS transporter permease subunit [Thermoleophilaceae bacterium]
MTPITADSNTLDSIPEAQTSRSPMHSGWTLALVSLALFMVTLDNLIVGVAIPSIRVDLGASLESLEWTVNAYTLTYAIFLMPAAALGDRFGRRRMFMIGLSIFTLASMVAAAAPTIDALVGARALQGFGAAIVTPLTLTLLAEAFPGERRGLALGVWSGVSGLGVALGPVIGGAVLEGFGSWQWIFGVNVPIGITVVLLTKWRLAESRGEIRTLDLRGLALVSTGLTGLTYAIVRGQNLGWGTAAILIPGITGVLLLVAFIAWEKRALHPTLPLRFFRSRGFSSTSVVSFAMFFGVFGSIFYLSQFFQTAQGYSPLEAGIRTLPWTAMPIFIAPLAGIFSDRIGARPFMAVGLTLQAIAITWISQIAEPTTPYGEMIIPFMIAGAGMAMVFAPAANAVLASVRPSEAGLASGATNAIREVGGVMGVSMLGVLFAANGSYASPQAYSDGVAAALPLGAAVLAIGAIAALFVPGLERMRADAELHAQADVDHMGSVASARPSAPITGTPKLKAGNA